MTQSHMIMCSNDELNTEYADASHRLWHLVDDQAKGNKALCGAKPSSGWAGCGLIATCVRCLDKAKTA